MYVYVVVQMGVVVEGKVVVQGVETPRHLLLYLSTQVSSDREPGPSKAHPQ